LFRFLVTVQFFVPVLCTLAHLEPRNGKIEYKALVKHSVVQLILNVG